MGECSFWYRPTRVVPDQRPLNGRCCCCCCCNATQNSSFDYISNTVSRKFRYFACRLAAAVFCAAVIDINCYYHEYFHRVFNACYFFFSVLRARRCGSGVQAVALCLSVSLTSRRSIEAVERVELTMSFLRSILRCVVSPNEIWVPPKIRNFVLNSRLRTFYNNVSQ